MATPKGIRNNNPGNIRHNPANDWQGQTGADSSGFAKFDSAKLGIRAAAKLLLNYQRLHGLNTIQEVISRWAPANENNTGAYIEHVATALETSPAEQIYLGEPSILAELVTVIIKHENGMQPYSKEVINEAVSMALA